MSREFLVGCLRRVVTMASESNRKNAVERSTTLRDHLLLYGTTFSV